MRLWRLRGLPAPVGASTRALAAVAHSERPITRSAPPVSSVEVTHLGQGRRRWRIGASSFLTSSASSGATRWRACEPRSRTAGSRFPALAATAACRAASCWSPPPIPVHAGAVRPIPSAAVRHSRCAAIKVGSAVLSPTASTSSRRSVSRARLLAHLAPYIEKIATGAPGKRSPELLRLANEDLATVAAPGVAAQVLTQIAAVPDDRLLAELAEAECWACCRHDPLFPRGLCDAADAPWALVGRGDPGLLGRLTPEGAVTVVGARRASTYGREVARELGRELAAAGLAVVSGLAFGSDACAHRGALDSGLTIAVLGCGADIAYPAAHRSLWRQISESGLGLSELPPGSGAWRWTFPARNRIMAALSGMTVVLEAAERPRSPISAELAADLCPDPRAVPRPVSSRVFR